MLDYAGEDWDEAREREAVDAEAEAALLALSDLFPDGFLVDAAGDSGYYGSRSNDHSRSARDNAPPSRGATKNNPLTNPVDGVDCRNE